MHLIFSIVKKTKIARYKITLEWQIKEGRRQMKEAKLAHKKPDKIKPIKTTRRKQKQRYRMYRK